MMKIRDAVITVIEEDQEVELGYCEESDKGNFYLQCYLLVHPPIRHDENVGQDLIMETSEGGFGGWLTFMKKNYLFGPVWES